MSHYNPDASRKSRKSRKSVTFEDDPPRYHSPASAASSASNSSFQAPHSVSYTPYVPQPGPTRHGSMPTRLRSRETSIRGVEALEGMRAYLKEACNFHGEHLRRALSVPSVQALSALISFVNALRNVSSAVIDRDEQFLNALIDSSKRHPHELLQDDSRFDWMPAHEANARRAHMKRERREAEHHLLVFVSRQLRLPMSLLRELSSQQRAQRELDAFKDRITRFNGSASTATRDDTAGGGTNSAPQSPVHRLPTVARSPRSEPIEDVRARAYDLPGRSVDELFLEMGELHLPGSSFDTGKVGASSSLSTAGHTPARRRAAALPGPSTAITDVPTMQHQPLPSPYASPFMGNTSPTIASHGSTGPTADEVPSNLPTGGQSGTEARAAQSTQASRSLFVGGTSAAAATPIVARHQGGLTSSPYVGPASYGTAAAPQGGTDLRSEDNLLPSVPAAGGMARDGQFSLGSAHGTGKITGYVPQKASPLSYGGTPPPAPTVSGSGERQSTVRARRFPSASTPAGGGR